MAFTISDCFVQQGSGTNEVYGTCCCQQVCSLTNESPSSVSLDSIFASFQNSEFGLISESYLYNGNPITSYPFFIPANESIQIVVDYCASNVGTIDTLIFNTEQNGGDLEFYYFDFEAIDMSTSVDIFSIDFGTVNLNTINQVYLTINNPTTCCFNYDILTDCVDTIISPSQTRKLCIDEFQSVQITWQPTTVGPFNCEITVGVDCQTIVIPVTGNVVEPPAPPSGGNDVSGKRTVVDCPSGNCGLFNPQPAFAQTTKNSIQQISRATLPKGGPGRGTNFGRK